LSELLDMSESRASQLNEGVRQLCNLSRPQFEVLVPDFRDKFDLIRRMVEQELLFKNP